MKFDHAGKIVVGSSIGVGLIILIPTLYFNLTFFYLLAGMLITTIVMNWYTKLTCESYNLQVRFDENQRLVLSILGKIGTDISVVHFNVKDFSYFFDAARLEQKLLEKNITINADNLLCIDNKTIIESKYLAMHRQMLFYRDVITDCINFCIIPNSEKNPNQQKRKSLIFWRR